MEIWKMKKPKMEHLTVQMEKIGRGSFADVFKVKRIEDGKDYVLKIKFRYAAGRDSRN